MSIGLCAYSQGLFKEVSIRLTLKGENRSNRPIL